MRCAYCSKPIRKHTTWVYLEQSGHGRSLGAVIYPEERGIPWPKTKADCQKLSNQIVTSIERGHIWREETSTRVRDEYVSKFSVWDGKTYSPCYGYFCTNNCAGWYARDCVKVIRAKVRA